MSQSTPNRVYIEIKSTAVDLNSHTGTQEQFEVYTNYDSSASPPVDTTTKTNSYGISTYTNTNPSNGVEMGNIYTTSGWDSSGAGSPSYEFVVYNNLASTDLYLTNDFNKTTPITIPAQGTWSNGDASSSSVPSNGHNPFDITMPEGGSVSDYGWVITKSNTTGTGNSLTGGSFDLSDTSNIYLVINPPTGVAKLYLRATAVDTTAKTLTYTLYSYRDMATYSFDSSHIISSGTTGSSINLENSFMPKHILDLSSGYGSMTYKQYTGVFSNVGVSPLDGLEIYLDSTVYTTLTSTPYNDIRINYTYYGSSSYYGFYSASGSADYTTSSLMYDYLFDNVIFNAQITAGGEDTYFTFTAVCFPPFTLIETPNGLTQIVDLKVGDEVKTQGGIVKVSKNMTTHTPGGATFVFFPKDCICEGFPSEDAYITEFHPIAIKNVEEDNKDVMHFIEARHFINKFKGIELKKLETKTYHNLVFDTVEIFNVGGMKMCSHHPNNTPIKLRKEEFLGEVNEREPVNLYYTFEKLLEDKKEDEDLGEYLKKTLSYN